MRFLLGLVLMLVAMVPGVAMAQEATSTACGISEVIGGKLVPQETDEGIYFAGEAGSFISEPFDLPDGTVLYATSMEGAVNGSVQVVEAPRSDASGGGLAGMVIFGEDTSMAGVLHIWDEGEFVMTVDSDVAWSLALEF